MNGFYHTEIVENIKFETHRRRKGETVSASKYHGCVEDYVWSVTPLDGIDFSRSRINLIKTEINDVHIPALEDDKNQEATSVVSYYQRKRIYRFGKLKGDRVNLLPPVLVYKNETKQ